MEKILVAVEVDTTSFWSLVYALNLAKRMQITISILLVSTPTLFDQGEGRQPNDQFPIKRQLEKLIIEGRSSGIRIDYYHTSGSFKDEIIGFIQKKKIDLFVLEKHTTENMSELIEEIKLRTHCRIELVQPKSIHEKHQE